MKDHLLQTVSRAPLPGRRNLAREYLQVYLLRVLHEQGALRRLAFLGGTALRLLHGMARFSEDLDFSYHPLRAEPSEQLAPEGLFKRVKLAVERAGYVLTVRVRADRQVANALLRFEGLPRELGLSSDPRVALSVKLEIDRSPPEGARIDTTLVQRFFPIALRHYDLPSLFAGKLHALLARPWAKGRDWYDLVWYLTEQRGLEPNLRLLENALKQTGHTMVSASDWRGAVLERLRSLRWSDVLADLRPFIERQADLEHFQASLVERLLGRQPG